jgi:hypothetical protein
VLLALGNYKPKTLKYHLTIVRIAIINKTKAIDAGKNGEKKGSFIHNFLYYNINHYAKQYGGILKNYKYRCHMIQVLYLLVYSQKK